MYAGTVSELLSAVIPGYDELPGNENGDEAAFVARYEAAIEHPMQGDLGTFRPSGRGLDVTHLARSRTRPRRRMSASRTARSERRPAAQRASPRHGARVTERRLAGATGSRCDLLALVDSEHCSPCTERRRCLRGGRHRSFMRRTLTRRRRGAER